MSRKYTVLSCLVGGLAVAALVAGCQPQAADEASEAPPELVVKAVDNDYPDPAETTAGWTKLTMKNEGTDLHQIALVKLEDGKTMDDFAAFAATAEETDPMPSWAVPAGGVAVAAPGQSASAFVDLEEGTYVMLCNIPDAKGVPHIKTGMAKPLTVAASDDGVAAAPEADVSLSLVDFAFKAPEELSAGSHVIDVKNEGEQLHEAVLVKLDEGATAEEVADALLTGKRPAAFPVGGVVGLPAGTEQSFPVDLDAGRYAYLCFLPDPATGSPHALLGMMQEFDVK